MMIKSSNNTVNNFIDLSHKIPVKSDTDKAPVRKQNTRYQFMAPFLTR